MNIYFLIERDEGFRVEAETVLKAVDIALKNYLESKKKELKEDFSVVGETKFYHNEVLHGCLFMKCI